MFYDSGASFTANSYYYCGTGSSAGALTSTSTGQVGLVGIAVDANTLHCVIGLSNRQLLAKASVAEVQAKSVDNKYVTPLGLAAIEIASATTTVKGQVELATNAESLTGTDTEKVLTPATLFHYLNNKAVVTSYNRLSDKPTSTPWSQLTGVPALAPSNAQRNVQANWRTTNRNSDSYIKNKPTIRTPVQSDWNQGSSSSLAYIRNKPTIRTPVRSDWNQSSPSSLAYIRNKPSIVTPVQSDWNATSGLAFIKNKPSVPTIRSLFSSTSGVVYRASSRSFSISKGSYHVLEFIFSLASSWTSFAVTKINTSNIPSSKGSVTVSVPGINPTNYDVHIWGSSSTLYLQLHDREPATSIGIHRIIGYRF